MIGTEVDPFVIGLTGAAIPVALGAWFVRRRTKAETTDIITEAAGRLVKDLERRIADLVVRETAAMIRISDLTSEVHTLRVQVIDLIAEVHKLRAQIAEHPGPVVTTTETVTSSVTKETPA